jgi:predicted ATPase/transcriptional regulator with XRE-family HTH domain
MERRMKSPGTGVSLLAESRGGKVVMVPARRNRPRAATDDLAHRGVQRGDWSTATCHGLKPDIGLPASFGALLRRHRRDADLTQAELAEAAELSERGIQHLEAERTRPYRATVERLATALGLTVNQRADLQAAAAAMPRRRDEQPTHAPSPGDRALVLVPSDARPSDTSLDEHRHDRRVTLPLALTRLIGRERDIGAICDALQGSRLVTLVGTGGIGKTRLALAVAERFQARSADGVCLVELASLTDPEMVPRAVAAALGLNTSSRRSPIEWLVDALGTRQLLLVLDNCEHLVDASASLVETLLRACPDLQVLATSRERLAVGGEVTWPVPPLAIPPAELRLSASHLAEYPAVRLFVDRAAAALPGFTLNDQHAAAAARICQRLDGLPLALELAAARVAVLTVGEIASRLDDPLRLLTTGSRTAPPRQQALRATLDWSYALLTESERTVLRQVAVFAGGWSLSAAERVGSAEFEVQSSKLDVASSPSNFQFQTSNPELPTDVLDVLAGLVAKSLVQVDRVSVGDTIETRYRLLETVRQYSIERLREAGEEDAARRRHSEWCAELAEQAEPRLLGMDQIQWLVRLDRERDNLRAALAWSLEHDPPLGLRIAASLWQFWRVRLFLTDGRRWLDRLLDRAPEPDVVRARTLLAAGLLAHWQLDTPVARDRLEAGFELALAHGDRALIGRASRDLGTVLWARLGDHRRAWALFEDGLVHSRAAGDLRTAATNLQQQSRLAAVEGDYRRAQSMIDESVALLSEVGDRWQLAISLEDAGGIALIVGQPERAEQLFDEVLAVSQALDAVGLGAIHRRLHRGTVAYWRGDAETAIAWYEQWLAVTRANGHTAGIVDNLIALARAVLLQGDVPRATELFAESLRLSEERADRVGTSLALHGLGLVAWRTGDASLALSRLRESLALRRELRDRLMIAESLEALGVVAMSRAAGQDAVARAVRWLAAADALREQLGTPRPPADRPAYAAAMKTAQTWRVDLGTVAAVGSAMSLDAVLDDAMSDTAADPPLAQAPIARSSTAPAPSVPSLAASRLATLARV